MNQPRAFRKEVRLIRPAQQPSEFVDFVWAYRLDAADRIELFGVGGDRYLLTPDSELELDFDS